MPLFAANLGADPLEPTKAPLFINADIEGTSAVKSQQTHASSPQVSYRPCQSVALKIVFYIPDISPIDLSLSFRRQSFLLLNLIGAAVV